MAPPRPLPPLDSVRERARAILARVPEVVAALVFGSIARGEAGPQSDLDIAVLLSDEGRRRHGGDDFKARLTADLMRAIGTSRLDLVLLHEAPPVLAHRALRDGTPIHVVDGRALAAFRFRTAQRYLDTKPLRELKSAALRQRLARGAFGRAR